MVGVALLVLLLQGIGLCPMVYRLFVVAEIKFHGSSVKVKVRHEKNVAIEVKLNELLQHLRRKPIVHKFVLILHSNHLLELRVLGAHRGSFERKKGFLVNIAFFVACQLDDSLKVDHGRVQLFHDDLALGPVAQKLHIILNFRGM